jgi:predicted house-cleaning noncanonical NTP pyrophosphatase (MazG superfamily)
MKKKILNKLIRDKVPEIIRKIGDVPEITILDEADFRKALKIKMTEQAKELLAADSIDEILNELSDVVEVARAVAVDHGLSWEEVETHRQAKLREKGGFEKKLFLKSVEES